MTFRLKVALVFVFCALAAPAFAASEGYVVSTCPSVLSNQYTVGSYGAIVIDQNGNACGVFPANQSVNITQLAGLPAGIVAANTDSATAVNPALVVSVRPDSRITLGPATDANSVPNVLSPTGSSTSGISPVVGGSAASSLVLKGSPGNLYSVYANCTSACWLMVFNSTSAPSNGATTAGIASGNLVECIPIGAGSIGGLNYDPFPAVYSVGITAAISSTACATLTLSTVGFIHGLIK